MDDVMEKLISIVEDQMENIECVDTHELGEVIDMIKDISEMKYYCAITTAMENKDTIDRSRMYYHKPEDEITFEEVMEDLGDLFSEATTEQKTTMKQKLASYVNKV